MRGKLLYVAAGAAAMYLLDPERGRGRRARLRDRTVAMRRRYSRRVEKLERHAANLAAGEGARRLGLGHHHPHGAVELREHLRGVVHHLVGHDVNVDVDEFGVVTLRGQVTDTACRNELVDRVAAEPGVEEVVDLLHLPGEPPPNKAAALDASARAVGGSAQTVG